MNTRHWIAGVVTLLGLHSVPVWAEPSEAEVRQWTQECRDLVSITTSDQGQIDTNTITCLKEMYRIGAEGLDPQTEATEATGSTVAKR